MSIYNLIEYSSYYSETTRSLWFYSKNEATNFDTDVANTNDFKSFKYKTKLLENTEDDNANGVLKDATIAAPSKYASNFWRSLEMSLINCKVKLKLKWTKYCALSAAGADNVNGSDDDNNNIIFTIKDTKIFVLVVTFSDNQKLSKFLNKGFERSVYWNEYKTKNENKNKTNEFIYFMESSFVGVISLFVLFYPNRNDDSKRFETRKYYLPK